ncbi:MAG: aminotransferase class I/II-fold pyridoxal phosphate-dependent enzyme [bacterium]|nr:aminotransferase class I/II-fold pyridoxal phosphate-dependent enzyme [bacterium]
MSTQFSFRSKYLEPSPLQDLLKKIKSLQADGREIINLGVGESFLNTPEAIERHAQKAINLHQTRYTPASGSIELRAGIAQRYRVKPEQVVISNGAKSVATAVFWTLIDQDQPVLMPTPHYPPYFFGIKSLGGKVYLLECDKNFVPVTSEMERYLQALLANGFVGLICLLLNTPNNPTGAVYSDSVVKEISQLAKRYRQGTAGIAVISDECYYPVGFEQSYLRFDPNAVIIGSFSKAYAMTGWRIGYGIMPAELAQKVTLYLETFSGCPNSIGQCAAVEALNQEPLIHCYAKQRELLWCWFKRLNIFCGGADGGFYAFPDFSPFMNEKNGINSILFAEHLLNQANVAVVPGIAFGDFDNCCRITCAVSENQLRAGLERIEKIIC